MNLSFTLIVSSCSQDTSLRLTGWTRNLPKVDALKSVQPCHSKVPSALSFNPIRVTDSLILGHTEWFLLATFKELCPCSLHRNKTHFCTRYSHCRYCAVYPYVTWKWFLYSSHTDSGQYPFHLLRTNHPLKGFIFASFIAHQLLGRKELLLTHFFPRFHTTLLK